ncbi:hypothetical protein lpari_00956 [Legionella parisiensis]|uniref:Uncharacterized protein n=1 Tax=Legionella parisiensis TaxID=45071 RepID=A0A1E5JU28_9GAMM|nr:hypothetical protein lpari_00956 [Legionella parisiensis]
MVIGPYFTDSGWVRFRQQGNHIVAETTKSSENIWETSSKHDWVVEGSETKESFRFLLKEGELFRIHHNEKEEDTPKAFRAVIHEQHIEWQPIDSLLQIEQNEKNDYQQLSPKMRLLFSLAKEDNGSAVSELITTLTPAEIIETDAKGFSLAYWLVRNGLQNQADLFYQQIKFFQERYQLGNKENFRQLHWGVICNQDTSLFSDYSADFFFDDEDNLSPLQLAVKYGNQKWVEYLLNKEAEWKNSLELAIEFGHFEVFKSLMNLVSDFQERIILLAVEKGQTEMVKLILERNSIILKKPEQIKSLFEKAVLSGNEQLIELFGNLLLPLEFENDSLEILNILIAQPNYNINAILEDGLTPMQLAVKSGAYNAVKKMANLGVDLHQKDSRGDSLLHLAARNDNDNKWNKSVKIVYFLVKKGLHVDAANHKGDTPLHLAASVNRSRHFWKKSIFYCLLLCGGKLDRKNLEEETPIDVLSVDYRKKEVTEFITAFRSFLGRIFNDKMSMDLLIGGQNAAVRKIFNENPEMPRGKAIFTILLSDKVDSSLLSKLAMKKGKEEVVLFLRALPAQEELAYINSILDEQNEHALKRFFYVQRGLLKPSIERGQLFALQQRQKELTTSPSVRLEDRVKPKPLHNKIDKAYVNVMSIAAPTRAENIEKVLLLLESDLMKNQKGAIPDIICEIRETIRGINPKITSSVISTLNEIRGVIASMDEKEQEKNDVVVSVLDVFANKQNSTFQIILHKLEEIPELKMDKRNNLP